MALVGIGALTKFISISTCALLYGDCVDVKDTTYCPQFGGICSRQPKLIVLSPRAQAVSAFIIVSVSQTMKL